uniref:Uncharacterized protein n=1 Tax=Knipowitschia caucasica TaxID=637954 RepID=A0AAV2JA49_KNICA
MYAVLVHSPDKKKYRKVPLLEESENCICAFRADPNPHFIWRPQAMCGTHEFFLEEHEENLSIRDFIPVQRYVWDHVSLVLDVGDKVLRFTEQELCRGLRFCKKDPVADRVYSYLKKFPLFEEANTIVQKLWPDSVPLQKFEGSDFHIYKEDTEEEKEEERREGRDEREETEREGKEEE